MRQLPNNFPPASATGEHRHESKRQRDHIRSLGSCLTLLIPSHDSARFSTFLRHGNSRLTDMLTSKLSDDLNELISRGVPSTRGVVKDLVKKSQENTNTALEASEVHTF